MANIIDELKRRRRYKQLGITVSPALYKFIKDNNISPTRLFKKAARELAGYEGD